jgi:hypothetical protein
LVGAHVWKYKIRLSLGRLRSRLQNKAEFEQEIVKIGPFCGY